MFIHIFYLLMYHYITSCVIYTIFSVICSHDNDIYVLLTQVIENPIDMETIETRIKSDYYGNERELLADFRLMLRNCVTYNEEGSVIHSDAKTLDKVSQGVFGVWFN